MKDKIPAFALFIWLTSVLLLWGLAFAPFADNDPSWVSTVREICFGKTPGGLPEMYGWLNLVLSPLAMLVAIFIIWSPATILNVIRKFFQSRISILLLTASAGIFLSEFYFFAKNLIRANSLKNYYQDLGLNPGPLSKPLSENYPVIDKLLPSFQLMDHQRKGGLVNASEIRGPAVLTFAYFHCETMCPLILQNSLQGIDRVNKKFMVNHKDAGNNLESKNFSLYVITLDPWRDKPGQFLSMAKKWNLPDYAHILTSRDPVKVVNVLDNLEVKRSRNESTGEIIHEGLVYILDDKAHIRYALINPGPDQIKDALERIIKKI